jgi:ABC-type uncharacterized transport system permease subunit
VWAGLGLIGVVLLWAPPDLAERIRSGDVITDLLRPIDPIWQLLAADLGRAGYAAVTRFVVPVMTGALVFDLFAPRRPATYALFVCSALLATVVCFGCRFLVNAAAYWLLDARGPNTFWTLASATLGGLYFPVWFFPDVLAMFLIYGTLFRRLFAYAAGFAFVAYFPTLALLDRADPLGGPALLGYASPAVAIAAVTIAGLIWRTGVRHYRSTGTTTAGDLVSRLAEVAALRDISVLEPTIEDVVARLYTRQRG